MLSAFVVLFAATACSAPAQPERSCSPARPDVGSVEGWVGYLGAHPGDVALVADDGRGRIVERRAHEVQPMASAGKVLNLVAYAMAVAEGTVSPGDPVRVGDWERWAVLGGGEQAHADALDDLGVPRNGMRARDPGQVVTLGQVVSRMIVRSDNAAPDYLRDLLGDDALTRAAGAVGWADPELPSTTGLTVSFFTPELLPRQGGRAARRAAEWEIARRYAYDSAFRADVDSRQVPKGADEPAFVEGGPGGTARQLASLWSAIAHGTFPGAAIARGIVERVPEPEPGLLAIGAKGGNAPGVLARGTEIRRDDGTVAVAVVLVRSMSAEDTGRVNRSSVAFNDFLTAIARDPSILPAPRCLPAR
ncbi:hypothetical protein BAY61_21960 [Prauserella marina]|uniref:Beta-lactamase enzyme family protein n=1 Tax=Prauserella marina TaxID=530584 RepID=A0A222VTH7_9PSEU|nr:hypothetical protein BAY61_21960 [Prauserella marina]PWV72539.1 beta-lactamase family protein [Prauserella marina]SDD77656.1 Beta-lactamase enzyme family protein [Prauserella marina]